MSRADAPSSRLQICSKPATTGFVNAASEDEAAELRGFGERVRVARERLNLKQDELAAALGTDAGTVSRWERGKGYPQTVQLARLATALGESLDHLVLGGTSSKGPVEMPHAFVEFLQTKYGRIAQERRYIPMLLAVIRAKPVKSTEADTRFYKNLVKTLMLLAGDE